MRGFVLALLMLSLVTTAQAANFTYTFGEQKVNLGWPHATADYHDHNFPSIADDGYFDLNKRYAFFLEKGKKHLQTGLKRAAVEDLAHASALEPYQPYARRLLGHALFGIGDYAGAAEQMKRACHLSYDFQQLKMSWPHYSAGKAEYDADLAALRQACARDPSNATLLYLLGVYRYYDRAYREALLALEGAQRLAPGDQDVNYFVHACRRKLH